MSGTGGVELATAYVSLVVESSQVSKQVAASLKAAEPQAQRAGEGIGTKLAGGVGTTFKAAAAGIGLIAGAAIGTAISKGFTRMVAIDDAKGKLAGLGHEAQGVASIMASANAAVKGTAFGMGEAATAAASAVAAGIQQGDALTNYLKLIGDTATIAGTDLASMGSIFNKVQTSGKAYTDDLNMLSDRGIPIFQWLQKEYGKSAEELSKMVKEGKVDAATFRKAIEENIGGAALESGKTLRGAWKNMQAALGRIGEAALSPFLPMMKSSLAGITEWADKIKPHVAKAAQYVATGLTEMSAAFQSHGKSIEGPASNWEKFGTKARFAADGLKGVYSLLKDGKYLGQNMTFGFAEDSKAVDFLLRVREAVSSLVQSVKDKDLDGVKDFFNSLRGGQVNGDGYTEVNGIGQTLTQTFRKLGDAASTVGKSLASILGDAGVVGSVVLEHFARALALVADNTWLVTAGLTAYAAAVVATKAVHTGFEAMAAWRSMLAPATISAQLALSRALVAHNVAIRAYLASIGQEIPVTQGAIASRLASARAWTQSTFQANLATSALQRWSAAAAAAAGVSNGLTGAFYRTAAGAAAMGARVQATAVTALTGLRNAASGAMAMVGGPWGVALGAATVGIMGYYAHTAQAKRIQDALAASVVAGAKAQGDLTKALAATNGELDKSGIQAAGKLIKANMAELSEVAKEGHSPWESFWQTTTKLNDKLREIQLLGQKTDDPAAKWFVQDDYDRTQRAIDQMDTLGTVLRSQRLDMDDLGEVIGRGGEEYDKLTTALRATGDAGSDILASIQSSREEILGISDAAKRSTPGLGTVKDAIQVLANTTSSADDKVSALKRTLDALAGKPVELEDAMQSYNDAIRSVIESTNGEKWDQSKGFGAELIGQNGAINTLTENGSKLRDTLKELRDESAQVAASGGDMGPIWQRNAQVLADLAKAVGLDAEQMKALAASVGYLPEQIELAVATKGADEAVQKLTVIKLLADQHRKDGVTLTAKMLGGDEVIRELQATGAKVQEVEGHPGEFRIEAPDIDAVLTKINELISKKIPPKTVSVTYAEATASGEWMAPMRLPAQPRAAGGPIFGAGGPTSDSIPALLSRDEHVLTAREVKALGGHQGVYSLRAAALSGGLKFAEGGTPALVSKAIQAARSVEGNTYAWGGTGPKNFDCSGFVGWLQSILMGLEGSTKRLYTTHSLLGGSTAGLESGSGPAGTWFKVGVSNDHMAATLAGQPVESGGAHGTSGIGGTRAGAGDSQFPWKFYLPNSLIKGYVSGQTGGKLVEWTDEDERDLERARIAVTQAKERRDEVYSKSDSTDSERRLADLDVSDAEAKVIKQQEQKDKQGTLEDGERVAPQAPALTEAYNAEKAARLDKLAAVEEANTARNEVYDDPTSSDLAKAQADQALAKAQEEANAVANDTTSAATTVRGIFTNAASSAAGVLFDAAKEIFLPEKVSSSHWWDVADKAVELANSDTDEDGKSNVNEILSSLPTFGVSDVMKQQGFNGAAPEWAKNVKVYDNGGWLMPGEMGINLSSRPEPIFNSPSQLAQFAGSTLQAPSLPEGAATSSDIRDLVEASVSMQPVTIQTDNLQDGLRSYGFYQHKQTLKSRRR